MNPLGTTNERGTSMAQELFTPTRGQVGVLEIKIISILRRWLLKLL
jgi:hypothetical protein